MEAQDDMSYTLKEENGTLILNVPFSLGVMGWIRKNIPSHERQFDRIEKTWIFLNPSHFNLVRKAMDAYFPKAQEEEDARQKTRDDKQKRKEEGERRTAGGGYKNAYDPPANTYGTADMHATLFLRKEAPDDVVKAVYRILAVKYHPDRNKDEDTTLKMQELNAAYDKIKKARGL